MYKYSVTQGNIFGMRYNKEMIKYRNVLF